MDYRMSGVCMKAILQEFVVLITHNPMHFIQKNED